MYRLRSTITNVFSFVDVPALHAGVFLVSIVLAGLFNSGSVGLLLVATLVLDVFWLQENTRTSTRAAVMAALRWNLQTITLFSAAFAIAVTMLYSAQSVSTAPLRIIISDVTVIRAIVTIVAKWKVIADFLYTLTSRPSRRSIAIPKGPLHPLELGCLIVVALSLLLLVLAPMFSLVPWDVLRSEILRELLPRLP